MQIAMNAMMNHAYRLLMVALLVVASAAPALSASWLPPGKSCFYGSDGAPLASGTVTFYVPGTTSPKDTWQNAAQSTLNTNPVALDASGCTLIFGNGSYRQILKNSAGVQIWDQVTAGGTSLSASWGGTSGGSANAQTVALSDFDLTDGQVVNFLAGLSNTTAMTLDVNSTGVVPVVRDSGAGPVALTGGEIVAGNVVSVLYVSSTGQFHLMTPTPLQAFDGPVYFTAVVTPTILAADQNDWTPSGAYASANTLRISSTTAITITGMTGGDAGRTLFVHNVGSQSITFSPNNAASLAANRFGFPTPIVLAGGDSITIQYDAVSSLWRNISPSTATLPPGYIFGCALSNNSGDATNDIDIAACQSSASNAVVDQRGIAMTKQLDASWAAGTNQGMRSSATLVDGTWHIFSISKTDGTTDYFAHNAIDPTTVLPSGYVYYRRIGSIVRASSAILGFFQSGGWFYLKAPPLDITNLTPGTSANTGTLASVPSGIKVIALINVTATNGVRFYVSSLEATDLTPSSTAAPLSSFGVTGASGTAVPSAQVMVLTNTSQQFRYRATVDVPFYAAPAGWFDLRGTEAP